MFFSRAGMRIIVVGLLVCSSAARAGEIPGSHVATAPGSWRWVPTIPMGRSTAICEYDPVRDRLLEHGGTTINYMPATDTWAMSLGASPPDWSNVPTTG